MTVADLIRELQEMPQHKPVRVVIPEINIGWLGSAVAISLTRDHATEADEVRFEGQYVLIQGK